MSSTPALGAVLESKPQTDPDSWTPALRTLEAQHDELKTHLRAGFDRPRDVLLWSHAVAAVSLGEVSDEWFQWLFSRENRYHLAGLLTDAEARDRLCVHPPDDRAARHIRDNVQHETLAPAFKRARKHLRSSAGDYTSGDGGVSDTENQRFIGMRPRVHQIAVDQHNALLATFEGMGSRREILDWANDVDAAALSYLPEGFEQEVDAPTSAWRSMLKASNPQGARLENAVAARILPAFNRALREAAKKGEEAPDAVDQNERNVGPEDAY